jgi:alpha-tubulin suppressor-like RCC1 family protein
MVSAGDSHTLLLRSDGSAVAIGDNSLRQCDIPPLDEGMTYTQVSAGLECCECCLKVFAAFPHSKEKVIKANCFVLNV